MITTDTDFKPYRIEKNPNMPTFKDVAQNPESGLRTVIRQEKLNGRSYTFYDTYQGDKLLEIQ